MKNLSWILLVSILFSSIFYSCKKEDDETPSPNEPTPDYYLKLERDGNEYLLKNEYFSDEDIGGNSGATDPPLIPETIDHASSGHSNPL